MFEHLTTEENLIAGGHVRKDLGSLPRRSCLAARPIILTRARSCQPTSKGMHACGIRRLKIMEYRTKEEQVADFLREGIIASRFPRGTRLKQLDIAKLLQTSITPVREALKLLAAEGYVVGDSYCGALLRLSISALPTRCLTCASCSINAGSRR
ncbi:GntR family transcriptional regulator [Enhydrobacter aerosaccus]|uniref:GntR family transcriptional regulator n=1 Tax=Enhydrobacter aerosaccus TaxID=225324 RepID=UPI001C462F11